MEVVSVTAAEEFAHGQTGRQAEDVPAGGINAALHARMPLERGVHLAIQPGELARVFTEQVRPEFAETGADAPGKGRQIKRTQRTHFAVTDESGVRLDADNRAVKNGDGLPARPFVGRLVQREFDAMGEDAGDFHGFVMIECGPCAGLFLAHRTRWSVSSITARGPFLSAFNRQVGLVCIQRNQVHGINSCFVHRGTPHSLASNRSISGSRCFSSAWLKGKKSLREKKASVDSAKYSIGLVMP